MKKRFLPRRNIHTLLHLAGPAVAGILNFFLMGEGDLVRVEDDVLVGVQDETVEPLQLALPFGQTQEAVSEGDGLVEAAFADGLDRGRGPGDDGADVEGRHARLVDQAVDGDDAFVPRLGEEGGELGVQVQRPLRVQRAVGPVQPADRALPPAVVPSVLAAGEGVQVQVDAQAGLAGVFDPAEQIAP